MHYIALIVNTRFTQVGVNVRLVMVQDNVEIVEGLEKHRPFMTHIRKDAEYVMEPVYVNHVNEKG